VRESWTRGERFRTFLADDGQTGSYSESEGSLWEVATSLSTCLCSRVLGNLKCV
jgi:hypothetical protein